MGKNAGSFRILMLFVFLASDFASKTYVFVRLLHFLTVNWEDQTVRRLS